LALQSNGNEIHNGTGNEQKYTHPGPPDLHRNKQDITYAIYPMITQTDIITHGTSKHSVKHKRAAIRHMINKTEQISVTSAAIIQEDGTHIRQQWVKHT
jgi:hypothetical protein